MAEPIDTDAIRAIWSPPRRHSAGTGDRTILILCDELDRLRASSLSNANRADEAEARISAARRALDGHR